MRTFPGILAKRTCFTEESRLGKRLGQLKSSPQSGIEPLALLRSQGGQGHLARLMKRADWIA